MQKTKLLLEEVQDAQARFVYTNDNLSDTLRNHPKVSRGENYLGLPYLILDYPRESSGGDFLFIRSMFWWGNFFSSTLHVSGSYKLQYEERIIRSYPLLSDHFIGINADPWVHHFEPDNYRPVGKLTRKQFEDICKGLDHVKIASKWPLDRWQEAPGKLFASWQFWVKALFSYPAGETGL